MLSIRAASFAAFAGFAVVPAPASAQTEPSSPQPATPSSPQPSVVLPPVTVSAAHAGQPTVVHFWGLTCGPCLAELPNWGRLLAERKDLRLVLLAADPGPQEPGKLAATLDRAGLGSAESWAFADRFYERLRYEIDPAWAGELPRTEMIARDGTVTVLRGVADLEEVRAWLDTQTANQLPAKRKR